MDFIINSVFGGVVITFLAYEIGVLIKNKLKIAIFNPLLISIVLIIGLLKCFNIDYEVYKTGSQLISYLLTPATVALAIPLYEQIEPHKKAQANKWWKEKIRQTLQCNPAHFVHDGRGMWSLNRGVA